MRTTRDEINKLSFLIGEWRGRGGFYGPSDDAEIINSVRFAYDPRPEVITGRFEARRSGKTESKGFIFTLYDPNIGRFVRKMIWSYGFIGNEIGEVKGDRFIFNTVSIDAEPDNVKGLRLRSFLQKVSENEFWVGLETAKQGEEFTLHGQNRFRRKA